ncbi:chromophore lyase CpcT/CpeT [Nostoc sp. CMAA1605]|uniref:chromophore lyase CpcT/CpeT n=1 Tax=Nostoc sp. CMAA1605 TaxID=2055159 RepID=UPI001F445615|nr:chromophore lyase CpcT/CpeT [Nostoc sp. CMAA1605]MCF4968585.1 CpeT/CpcT protein [Nostoc sp. CMAA1605]
MMNRIKAYAVTFLLSLLTIPTTANAANATTLAQQVKQVANWFTGFFDNSQQVTQQPTVPLISITSCSIQLDSTNNSENIYFEQESSFFERLRLYSFSQGNEAVNLSIRSFLDANAVRGLCGKPQSMRIIPTSNLPITSCNLSLVLLPDKYYTGSNSPDGCPAGLSRVVSSITVRPDSILSLDQIFNSEGVVLANTPIKFRRVSVPEPTPILAIIGVGIWGTTTVISRQLKYLSQKNSV